MYDFEPKLSRQSKLVSIFFRRDVLPREEPSRCNHGSGLHSRAQQIFGLLRMDEGRADSSGKVGRDGNSRRGLLPWVTTAAMMGVAILPKDDKFCSDAGCPLRGMLVAQQAAQLHGWSGHSSLAGVKRKELGDLRNYSGKIGGLEHGEFDRNVLLDRRL